MVWCDLVLSYFIVFVLFWIVFFIVEGGRVRFLSDESYAERGLVSIRVSDVREVFVFNEFLAIWRGSLG